MILCHIKIYVISAQLPGLAFIAREVTSHYMFSNSSNNTIDVIISIIIIIIIIIMINHNWL